MRNYLPNMKKAKYFNTDIGVSSNEDPFSNGLDQSAKDISESQIILPLPQISAFVKNVYFEQQEEEEEQLHCDIYVYKDQEFVKRLIKRPYQELKELKDFIQIKYSKRYIS